jgi:REP element-mobilizing transposase RayT
MASYISNYVHFVWSTKDRRSLIREHWQDRLYSFLGGILRNKKSRLICAGGLPDHVHILASMPATVSLSAVANTLKANSSRWVHEHINDADDFSWQEGYGAFSVSKSAEARVVEYIRGQKEHHRKRDFKEEFVALLKKHKIDYDEKYLWS